MKVIPVAAAKEYVQVNYPNDLLLKAMANTILDRLPGMEMEPEDKSRWKSVKDGLPTEGKTVLVWHKAVWGRECGLDTDRVKDGRWVRWGTDVTHWAPAAAWMVEGPK